MDNFEGASLWIFGVGFNVGSQPDYSDIGEPDVAPASSAAPEPTPSSSAAVPSPVPTPAPSSSAPSP